MVTFTVKDSVAQAVTYTAKDTTDNITLTQTATVTFTPLPQVVSINLANPNPTALPSVSWTVTFSSSVSGVSITNFALDNSGLTGMTITGVSGSGTTWTVTASTGTGDGTLGLNLSNITNITPTVNTILPFIGQVYTVNKTCFTDNFDGTLSPNWSVGLQGGTYTPQITGSRLRLTDLSGNAATWATLQRIFPAAGNKVTAEFDHYAYSGGGADGIAVILSNAAIPPVAGAFGGSMGYAQKGQNPVSDCTTIGGCPGFAGGWMGIALDEYGNYSTNTEGRVGGFTARALNSVAIRGSGSGMSGYRYLIGTGSLTPTINNTSTADHYLITVDHTDNSHAWVSVERQWLHAA
ncbi:MAG: hypothetical protein NT087_03480 [Deltaproteobacteria bacterium]|nr:hypothetical protein [Deltaproteobacteria bacterium]